MIARAADGSARDGLSLLDQAIALSHGAIDEAQVRDMLGLADRTQLIDLYDDVLKGKAPEALKRLNGMHQAGADAAIVLQDMLELTHWLTRAKITPEPLSDPATPEAERAWGAKVTPELSVPVLARLWQMLLKGLGEVQAAPQPLAAAEMVLIRLMHAANMPRSRRPGAALERRQRCSRTRSCIRIPRERRWRPRRAGIGAAPADAAADRAAAGASTSRQRRRRRRRCRSRRASATWWRCSTPGAKASSPRICNPTCIWCSSRSAASISAPASARRATCRTASPPALRNGPASAGWSASPPRPARRR